MNENLKYFGKLSLIGLFTLVKIYVITFASTFFALFSCLTINLTYMESAGSSGAKAAHVSGATGLLYVVQLMKEYPIQSLIYVLLTVSLFVIIPMGMRYTIRKLSNKVVHERRDDILIPLLDKIGIAVKEKTPDSIKSLTKITQAKVLMLKYLKASNENRWLKKAAAYGIKKVNTLDIDFEKKDLNVFDEVQIKALAYLEQISKPNKNWFLISIGIQWTLVLVFYLLTTNKI